MNEELLKPAEVCEKLAMPPSTLRVYSTRFADVLSETARKPPVGPDGRVGHRLYNGRDLVVLTKAKELLAQGLTYEQVLAELRLTVPGAKARGRVAGPAEVASAAGPAVEGVETFGAALRLAVGAADKAVDTLKSVADRQAREIDELRARVSDIEKRLKELEQAGEKEQRGFWQRLFGG
ncbi:MAG: MerR family transcriptional regulator [Dehalococcoidales bacterium]|nr:MerR family transcriptional regulator [Dehalococcoidales bacterium]